MNLVFLLRYWKVALIGLAAIIVLSWIALLKTQLHFAQKGQALAEKEAMQWQATADQYLQANIESQAAFETYKKQASEWEQLARRQIEAAALQVKVASQIRKDIEDAPETDNRPVGPILNFTLDCLRQFQSGAASCRH